MKKLSVFGILLVCLVSTSLFKGYGSLPVFEVGKLEKVCFVASDEVKEAEFESVRCGDLFFNFCSAKVAEEKLDEMKDCKSVQFYYDDLDLKTFLLKFKGEVVSETELDNLKVFNCHTPYASNFILLDNKKVNMQIACSEGKLIAGFPILLTGY